jgi:zinc transporter 1/2/3
MQGTQSRVGAVAVAICAHKGPAAFSVGSKFMRSGLPTAHVIALVLAFTLVTPFGIVVGILSGGATPIAKLVLEGLGAGTFIYIGATEISSDEFEMTARACDEMHGVSSSGGKNPDAEKAGHTHTHHSHEPPSRSARLLAFSAYGAGVFVILMSNLAPHAD